MTHKRVFKHLSDNPEGMDIVYKTTGYMGGDAGHGGRTSVTFSCDNEFNIYKKNDKVTIEVCGDWEKQGLDEALVSLGNYILKEEHYDA